jgi:hypothetical protein
MKKEYIIRTISYYINIDIKDNKLLEIIIKFFYSNFFLEVVSDKNQELKYSLKDYFDTKLI